MMIQLQDAWAGLPVHVRPDLVIAVAPAPWTDGMGHEGERLSLVYVFGVDHPFRCSESVAKVMEMCRAAKDK